MSMIAQEYNAVTKAMLGNHARFPQPEFAFVIYEIDMDDDSEIVHFDSVWTNEEDAVQRMKTLERYWDPFFKAHGKNGKRYVRLHGLTGKFPFPDGCSIMNEDEFGRERNSSWGIFCKRIFLNKKNLLSPPEKQ